LDLRSLSLLQEPELLGDEEKQIKRNMQATSVANHGAFIETAHCLSTINTELSNVCSQLDVLLKVLIYQNAAPMNEQMQNHWIAQHMIIQQSLRCLKYVDDSLFHEYSRLKRKQTKPTFPFSKSSLGTVYRTSRSLLQTANRFQHDPLKF
jgi:hypothetical protein